MRSTPTSWPDGAPRGGRRAGLRSDETVLDVDSRAGRDRAVTEMVRVLRPGGRVMVADFLHAGEYAKQLEALGMHGVATRSLGWRGWYSGPWLATRMVTATKPA